MAFNLEDKVEYTDISPSLQQLINNKVDKTIFDRHDNDEIRHIIQDERNYWNDIERICKEYTDDEINKLDKKLTQKIDNEVNRAKKEEKNIYDLINNINNEISDIHTDITNVENKVNDIFDSQGRLCFPNGDKFWVG